MTTLGAWIYTVVLLAMIISAVFITDEASVALGLILGISVVLALFVLAGADW